MVGPAALFVIAIILYAATNFFISIGASGSPASNDLFGDSSEASPLRAISNIILYLFSAISILTFLPGMIVGIILLVKRADERHALSQ